MNTRTRTSGFTLLELSIALAISSVVLLAMASMVFSVAQGWQAGDGTQALGIQSAQVYARVRKSLAPALYIGAVNPGSLNGTGTPGAIMFWVADNWGGSADAKVEVGEVEVIQHDPTTQTLWLYQTIPVATMTNPQKTLAGAVWPYAADFTNTSYINTFTNPTPAGLYGNYVSRTALGRNVIRTFAVDWMTSTTQRPVVECTLVLSRPPQLTATQYEAITLRAPAAQPQ